MTYFRQEECKDCDEGKIWKVAPRFTRNMEFEYDEEAHDCIECDGTGIIEIEEEDNE
jgi:hypothetical protein